MTPLTVSYEMVHSTPFISKLKITMVKCNSNGLRKLCSDCVLFCFFSGQRLRRAIDQGDCRVESFNHTYPTKDSKAAMITKLI